MISRRYVLSKCGCVVEQSDQICLCDVIVVLGFFPPNQDLKANESRLRDINKVASELESEGLMAEEAPVMQAQVRHQFGWLRSKAAGVGNPKFNQNLDPPQLLSEHILQAVKKMSSDKNNVNNANYHKTLASALTQSFI